MFGLNWLVQPLLFVAFHVIKGDSEQTDDPALQKLLARAKRADSAALGALYDQYVDKIYSYIYHRVGQAELAEDLTGQVFMRMLESIRTNQAWRSSFSGWLYRIAHNLVIDYYRRRDRSRFTELEEMLPVTDATGDVERVVQGRLERERLREALRQLTEEQAQVIVLRFLEDLSIAEVAAIMDKTEGAIKALQYRALLALRKILQP